VRIKTIPTKYKGTLPHCPAERKGSHCAGLLSRMNFFQGFMTTGSLTVEKPKIYLAVIRCSYEENVMISRKGSIPSGYQLW
jgi:hypothetical protein